MKKFLLMMALLLTTLGINAQETTTKFDTDNILLDLEVGSGTTYKHLQQYNLSLDLGYLLFNRVYPYARYESSLMLYHPEGIKHYGNTYNLGGGVGVILKKSKKESDDVLHHGVEFTANVTTSVGGHDYRNTSYYAGFRFGTEGIFLGLGFRRMQAHDSAHFPSYNAFVVSIGL